MEECWICGNKTKVNYVNELLHNGWGGESLKITGIKGYKCVNCEETVLSKEVSKIVEQLSILLSEEYDEIKLIKRSG